jgi:hypothetical protein
MATRLRSCHASNRSAKRVASDFILLARFICSRSGRSSGRLSNRHPVSLGHVHWLPFHENTRLALPALRMIRRQRGIGARDTGRGVSPSAPE